MQGLLCQTSCKLGSYILKKNPLFGKNGVKVVHKSLQTIWTKTLQTNVGALKNDTANFGSSSKTIVKNKSGKLIYRIKRQVMPINLERNLCFPTSKPRTGGNKDKINSAQIKCEMGSNLSNHGSSKAKLITQTLNPIDHKEELSNTSFNSREKNYLPLKRKTRIVKIQKITRTKTNNKLNSLTISGKIGSLHKKEKSHGSEKTQQEVNVKNEQNLSVLENRAKYLDLQTNLVYKFSPNCRNKNEKSSRKYQTVIEMSPSPLKFTRKEMVFPNMEKTPVDHNDDIVCKRKNIVKQSNIKNEDQSNSESRKPKMEKTTTLRLKEPNIGKNYETPETQPGGLVTKNHTLQQLNNFIEEDYPIGKDHIAVFMLGSNFQTEQNLLKSKSKNEVLPYTNLSSEANQEAEKSCDHEVNKKKSKIENEIMKEPVKRENLARFDGVRLKIEMKGAAPKRRLEESFYSAHHNEKGTTLNTLDTRTTRNNFKIHKKSRNVVNYTCSVGRPKRKRLLDQIIEETDNTLYNSKPNRRIRATVTIVKEIKVNSDMVPTEESRKMITNCKKNNSNYSSQKPSSTHKQKKISLKVLSSSSGRRRKYFGKETKSKNQISQKLNMENENIKSFKAIKEKRVGSTPSIEKQTENLSVPCNVLTKSGEITSNCAPQCKPLFPPNCKSETMKMPYLSSCTSNKKTGAIDSGKTCQNSQEFSNNTGLSLANQTNKEKAVFPPPCKSCSKFYNENLNGLGAESCAKPGLQNSSRTARHQCCNTLMKNASLFDINQGTSMEKQSTPYCLPTCCTIEKPHFPPPCKFFDASDTCPLKTDSNYSDKYVSSSRKPKTFGQPNNFSADKSMILNFNPSSSNKCNDQPQVGPSGCSSNIDNAVTKTLFPGQHTAEYNTDFSSKTGTNSTHALPPCSLEACISQERLSNSTSACLCLNSKSSFQPECQTCLTPPVCCNSDCPLNMSEQNHSPSVINICSMANDNCSKSYSSHYPSSMPETDSSPTYECKSKPHSDCDTGNMRKPHLDCNSCIPTTKPCFPPIISNCQRCKTEQMCKAHYCNFKFPSIIHNKLNTEIFEVCPKKLRFALITQLKAASQQLNCSFRAFKLTMENILCHLVATLMAANARIFCEANVHLERKRASGNGEARCKPENVTHLFSGCDKVSKQEEPIFTKNTNGLSKNIRLKPNLLRACQHHKVVVKSMKKSVLNDETKVAIAEEEKKRNGEVMRQNPALAYSEILELVYRSK